MTQINEILRQRRIELGKTMLDVAKDVGVSEGTVSRWESGDIANMRRDKIAALAKTLRLSPATIMGWTDETNIGSGNNCVVGDVASSTVAINNGQQLTSQSSRPLTTQERDMLRIYNSVGGKTQLKIMEYMYETEEREHEVHKN